MSPARRGGRVSASGAAFLVAVGATPGATLGLGAQQPARPETPRDTIRPPASDSAARDSVVARTLEQDTLGAVRPAAFSVLGLDRLRLRTVGASVGVARPGQAIGTRLYSLQADYGELLSGVRLVFTSTYWATRYRDEEVARLAREVGAVVVDPAGDDSVVIGRVRLADLSAGADLRWEPGVARRAHALVSVIHPWLGAGFAAHFVNVEGRPVSNTFIERALDAAAIGLSGTLGLDVTPLPNIQLTAQARYDFMSGVRYGSVRTGASFVFGPLVAR